MEQRKQRSHKFKVSPLPSPEVISPSRLPRITIQSALLRGKSPSFSPSWGISHSSLFINQICCTVNLLHLFFTTVRVPTHQDVRRNKGEVPSVPSFLAHGRCLLWSSTRCGKQTELQVSFRWVSGVFLEPHLTHLQRWSQQVCNDRWRQSTPFRSSAGQSAQQLKDQDGAWTHSPVGRRGRIPGAQPCPGAALPDPSSQRDPGDSEEKGAFKSSFYDQCLVKEDLYWTKMVVAYCSKYMGVFWHSSYWGNIFLLAGCN